MEVSHVKKHIPLQRPLRLLQLSDLHVSWFIDREQLEAWVRQANSYQADMVIITGDFLDAWFRRDRQTLEPLATLHAPQGIWAVLGNHDRIHQADTVAFQNYLASLGIQLLVDDWQQARADLIIAGAQDYTDHISQGEPALASWLEQCSHSLQHADDAANYTHAKILMLHNPDFLPVVAQSRCHFDIILCGHTHGGQIRLPRLGPVYTSSRFGTRFVSGWQAEFRAYISRGLGVTSLPIRWNCPAEMVVWELEPDMPH